jgi:hypothetical protein
MLWKSSIKLTPIYCGQGLPEVSLAGMMTASHPELSALDAKIAGNL